MDRARKIVRPYPIDDNHINTLQLEEKEDLSLTWLRASEAFLHKELGFRVSQIRDMGIQKLIRTKKRMATHYEYTSIMRIQFHNFSKDHLS